MKNKYYYIAACCLLFFSLTGCEKNESFYYPDNDYPGTAIFSNTGNNVLSCFMDGTPWKTIARQSGGFFVPSVTELTLFRVKTRSLLDTLLISWDGGTQNASQYGVILLVLPIQKQFQWRDIAAFQGKRLTIDSTNGYFSIGLDFYSYYNYNYPSFNGKGVIYFNSASIDSLNPDNIKGRISGLLEAHFYPGTMFEHNITSGRFDDNITAAELRNY